MMKKNRIENFASSWRQTKRDIGDTQNRFCLWKFLFDESDTFNGFCCRTDVLCIASRAWEDKWIPVNIFRRKTMFFGKEFMRSCCNFKFALSCDSHPLLWVIINTSHDNSSAIFFHQWNNFFKALFAIFKINRVNNG